MTSLAHVRESLTILLREILTILLPPSPWHVVYFHMPSDAEEPESRHSEVSLYPSTTGQFLLGCAGGRLLGAFLAGYSLQVVQKEALSAGRQAADLQAAPVEVGSCGSVVFLCASLHNCCSKHPTPAQPAVISTQTATDTAWPFCRSFIFLLISLLLI